jgi:hypothetical protein
MTSYKKRVYVIVLLVGGAALLVDRFVLTQSATAPAFVAAVESRIPAPSAHPDAAPLAKESLTDMSVPELPFPRNIPPWDAGAPIRDLFLPSVEQAADNDRAGTGRNGDPIEGSCAVFAKQHRLDGVLIQQGLKIAVVNGRTLRIDESLGGCTFISTDGNMVRFRCRDGEISLSLHRADESEER